jgi:hypothetical protein
MFVLGRPFQPNLMFASKAVIISNVSVSNFIISNVIMSNVIISNVIISNVIMSKIIISNVIISIVVSFRSKPTHKHWNRMKVLPRTNDAPRR